MVLSPHTVPEARPRRGAEHWAMLAGALAVLAVLVVLGTWVQPDPRGFGTHEQLGLSPCRMLLVTGLPCPGCGVTTSASLLAHGEVRAAFHVQPFGLLCALMAPVLSLYALVQHARGRDLAVEARRLRPGWWLVALGLAALAAWLWKIAQLRPGLWT